MKKITFEKKAFLLAHQFSLCFDHDMANKLDDSENTPEPLPMNEFEKRSQRADNIVAEGVLWSVWTGAIPINVLDFLFNAAVQLRMIKQLCLEYNVRFSEVAVRSYLTLLISNIAASFFSHAATKSIRLIPGMGWIYAAVGISLIAGATTYAIGKVFQKHFESGGCLEDFENDLAQRNMDRYFMEGMEFAKNKIPSRISTANT